MRRDTVRSEEHRRRRRLSIMTAVQDSAEPTAKDNTTEAVPASIVASMPDESDDTSTFYQSWSPTHHDLRLPAPAVPPPEKYVPVEKFVAAAMEPIHRARGAVITTAQRSKEFLAIVEILHKRDDAAMLHYILLALRTGGHGTVLSMISADSSRYGPMFRLIFNLNPFELSGIRGGTSYLAQGNQFSQRHPG